MKGLFPPALPKPASLASHLRVSRVYVHKPFPSLACKGLLGRVKIEITKAVVEHRPPGGPVDKDSNIFLKPCNRVREAVDSSHASKQRFPAFLQLRTRINL
jgi:hypothetical protein